MNTGDVVIVEGHRAQPSSRFSTLCMARRGLAAAICFLPEHARPSTFGSVSQCPTTFPQHRIVYYNVCIPIFLFLHVEVV